MRLTALVAALCLSALSLPAQAALPVGAKAPNFSTEGALAGKQFRLRLSEQLRKGPVVLYFFPKAFTQGCTLETREFAERIGEFRKAGATVVGMSGDNLKELSDFSVKECSGKFPVAMAKPGIIKGFDVEMKPGITNRTSYVIAPNGRIIYAHSEMDYRHHVSNTLAAVQKWKAGKR
jgi:thioredoxin-dependent peroxiredoxin